MQCSSDTANTCNLLSITTTMTTTQRNIKNKQLQ